MHTLIQAEAPASKLQTDHQKENAKKVAYEGFNNFHRDRLQRVKADSLLSVGVCEKGLGWESGHSGANPF
ncbi:hypothetical protein MS5N3_24350 [Marinobacter salsuginis]|uniref:Uncharacterized protein n=1 Tax=Marinobacter salsuginis TaxID=418719 RepID=A0A5M3PQ30_9GAMM|nr:hypothetical protein MS5N3_24350 [Marinobacter salsuginis]